MTASSSRDAHNKQFRPQQIVRQTRTGSSQTRRAFGAGVQGRACIVKHACNVLATGPTKCGNGCTRCVTKILPMSPNQPSHTRQLQTVQQVQVPAQATAARKQGRQHVTAGSPAEAHARARHRLVWPRACNMKPTVRQLANAGWLVTCRQSGTCR